MKTKIESYQDTLQRLYPNSKKSALTVTFQITDDCNLKCKYCYQINKGHHVMPLSVAQKFIDLLLSNDDKIKKYIDPSNYAGVILEFIGGEPFLQINLIDQIITYFINSAAKINSTWAYNWRINMSSNGTLYFKPEVQNFIKKYQYSLSLNISIDGNKQLHDSARVFPDGTGSHDLAVAARKHYLENYYPMIGNKITISPDNLQYLYESIKYYIEDLHETEIWGNVVFEKGWTNQHATEYYYQLKNIANYLFDNDLEEDVIIGFFQNDLFHPISHDDDTNYCGGNGQMISVDYKGDIYPCIRFMESSLGESVPPVILGNVYDGMLYTEEQEKMYKELSSTKRLNQSTPKCIDCMIATGCAWCSGYNYQDSGVFNHRATYICVMHQARSLANVYFWNKYYRKHNILKRFKMYLEEEKSLQIIPKEELELLKEIQYPIL